MRACVCARLLARAKNEHQNITTSVSPISLFFFFSFLFFFFSSFFPRKDGCFSYPNYDVMAVISVYKCRGDTELLLAEAEGRKHAC